VARGAASRPRAAGAIVKGCTVKARAIALLLALLGCESIAGVQDVTFLAGPCPEYCDTVLEACPEPYSVYQDRNTCLHVCALLDQGKGTGPANTVACRLAQARQAVNVQGSDKGGFCTAAGPSGGTHCTTNGEPDCEGYCTIYSQVCSSKAEAEPQVSNVPDCIKRCKAVQPLPGGQYSAFEIEHPDNDTQLDTLACRLYYASAAAVDPAANCDNAGLRPAGPCQGDPSADPVCEQYCQAVDVACPGTFQVYESTDQCLAVCRATTPGSKADSGGQNTIGCRSSHAFNALLKEPGPEVHCTHAGPAGDGVCSEKEDGNCQSYCRLAAAATTCSAEYEEHYPNGLDDCMAECVGLSDAASGKLGYSTLTAKGDTLKCRILQVSLALENPESAPCSAVFGGSPCD
jgi:hypothetical protein